jgi:Matrixin
VVLVGVALTLLLDLLVERAQAHAYCRSTTGKDNRVDGRSCLGSGTPVAWQNRCIGYSIARDTGKTENLDRVTELTARAFAKWQEVTCAAEEPSDGTPKTGPPRFQAADIGPVSCVQVGFRRDSQNQNAIVIREQSWPYGAESDAIAKTTTTFNVETGEVVDADIEVNASKFAFYTGETPEEINSEAYDLESVLTHEIGHFLGLAHSWVATAAMYQAYQPGEVTKRFLKPDDVDGICAVYPFLPERAPLRSSAAGSGGTVEETGSTCTFLPRGGLATSTCAESAPEPAAGCSCRTFRDAEGTWNVFATPALCFVGAVLIARRRKRRTLAS